MIPPPDMEPADEFDDLAEADRARLVRSLTARKERIASERGAFIDTANRTIAHFDGRVREIADLLDDLTRPPILPPDDLPAPAGENAGGVV